ncbi:MAG TPA: hypothetical protein ENG82_00940 [Bacteroidetes bacterium]|nr:hypothetical protein [Bacteroidota bacterium]
MFNIACGKRITINKLIRAVNEVLGKAVKPVYADPRPGDVKHSLANIGKARQFLGYEAKVDFYRGIRRVIEDMDAQTESGEASHG